MHTAKVSSAVSIMTAFSSRALAITSSLAVAPRQRISTFAPFSRAPIWFSTRSTMSIKSPGSMCSCMRSTMAAPTSTLPSSKRSSPLPTTMVPFTVSAISRYRGFMRDRNRLSSASIKVWAMSPLVISPMTRFSSVTASVTASVSAMKSQACLMVMSLGAPGVRRISMSHTWAPISPK